MSMLQQTLSAIVPADLQVRAEAELHQTRLTKPIGSLGVLEVLGARLAAMTGQCPPPLLEPVAAVLFAADHGVLAQGVSPWPQEVTAQMVLNFLAGGAVISVFGRQVGAELHVVDMGVATPLPAQVPDGTHLHRHPVGPGTADLSQGPAMTREQARQGLETGIAMADELIDAGHKLLLIGDMGIGNTTASAALVAVFAGQDPAEVTGRGTGIDDATLMRKISVIRRGLEVNTPDASDPLGVLAAVGGFEHAGQAGLLLGAARRGIPVIIDGIITQSAALVAGALAPTARDYWIAGHRSAEPGSIVALELLGLTPLLDLGMRLGEATGAALAVPLVQAAARVLREVATFEAAGVSEAG